MLCKLFFVVLFITLTSCEEFEGFDENPFRSNESRIVNGQILDIEDVPYYVSVFKLPDRHICGGSIISIRFILSAAHCFHLEPLTGYQVRSGTSRISRGGRKTPVNQIVLHPNYIKSTEDNDFALLRLQIALIYNERTMPIQLPTSTYTIPVGNEVLVSGHGDTKNPQQSIEFLSGAVLKISDFATCNTAYGGKLTSNMICGGTENQQDSCQGDSGGPLESLTDGILVGVVSFGTGCADPNFPGVYSKVAAARDWIRRTARV